MDDILLQDARRFDTQALTEIYDRYSPRLYAYAMRLLGDEQQAEDCLAETFTRFLGSLKAGKGPREHLQAYLYRVAHNWITDLYRGQPHSALILDDEQVDNSTPQPPQAVEERLQQGRTRAALCSLTPEQSQVLALKFLEGWQNDEIAAAMKKPIGAIKSLQHRALAALQRKLFEEDPDDTR